MPPQYRASDGAPLYHTGGPHAGAPMSECCCKCNGCSPALPNTFLCTLDIPFPWNSSYLTGAHTLTLVSASSCVWMIDGDGWDLYLSWIDSTHWEVTLHEGVCTIWWGNDTYNAAPCAPSGAFLYHANNGACNGSYPLPTCVIS